MLRLLFCQLLEPIHHRTSTLPEKFPQNSMVHPLESFVEDPLEKNQCVKFFESLDQLKHHELLPVALQFLLKFAPQ